LPVLALVLIDGSVAFAVRIQTSANSRFSWAHVVPDECHISNRLPSGIFPRPNTNINNFFTVDVADGNGIRRNGYQIRS
jgi:hypothetical protein